MQTLAMPYECATDLVLKPLNSGEAKAWVYHGSRMLYIIQQRLATRSLIEQYNATAEMLSGGDKEMRQRAAEKIQQVLIKAHENNVQLGIF